MLEHEIVIGLLVLPWKSDVLVHVECLDIFEGEFAGFVVLHQLSVHLDGGGACGQSQDEVAVGTWLEVQNPLLDVPSSPFTNRIVIVTNYKLHSLGISVREIAHFNGASPIQCSHLF